MDVVLNGSLLSLDKPINIYELLVIAGYKGKLVAVAVNGDFLPKSSYECYVICVNDEIEIVSPMQGG